MCGIRISRLLGRTTVLIVICYCSLSAEGKYGGGTGEPNDPYLIYDANQMNAIGADANDWDKHFLLTNDIDLAIYNGENGHQAFNMIGGEFTWSGSSYKGVGFSGVFDGNEHVIYNLKLNMPSTNCVGLFRSLEGAGTQIKNLGIYEPNIIANSLIGGIAGIASHNTLIINCWIHNGSIIGSDKIGGIVGYNTFGSEIKDCRIENIKIKGGSTIGGVVGYNNNGGYITRCYSTGEIFGSGRLGGFSGHNRESFIEHCFSEVDVYGSGDIIGGFTGGNSDYGDIFNCYARGDVFGADLVGGFVGNKSNTAAAQISRCYAVGRIVGSGYYVGGIAGRYMPDCSGGEDNLFDIETAGITRECGGKGRTTMQMHYKNTFTSVGWDFDTPIWVLPCNDYPRLWWDNRPPVPQPTYSGGSGTEFDPYLISTAEELHSIAKCPCHFERHFTLIADIDLSNYNGLDGNPLFNRIGLSHEPFTGVFDGNGHTISNFTYNSTGTSRIGLFGFINEADAIVKDLGLINPNVNAGTGRFVGSLVGYLGDGTISGCFVRGGSVSGDHIVGGLAGVFNGDVLNSWFMGSVTSVSFYAGGLIGQGDCNIFNSYSIGEITSEEFAGGLVGHFNGSAVSSYSVCDITTYGGYSGGLIGWFNSGSMTYCYSGGNVSGHAQVGGLVGFCSFYPDFFHCYSYGEVNGVDVALTGGLIGNSFNGDPTAYTKLFWNNTVNPSLSGIGNLDIVDVVGISSEEMQIQSTFTDVGWDFVGESINGPNDIWRLCVDLVNYPRLAWEFPLGDFLCPDGVDFIDFSFFAVHWAEVDCGASNDCEGTDLDQLGTVDIKDLGIFADNWLRGF